MTLTAITGSSSTDLVEEVIIMWIPRRWLGVEAAVVAASGPRHPRSHSAHGANRRPYGRWRRMQTVRRRREEWRLRL